MINKRLKDALFTDQWSELFMDALAPFNFVLVMLPSVPGPKLTPPWVLVPWLCGEPLVSAAMESVEWKVRGAESESPLSPRSAQVSTVRMQGVILLLFAKYYHLPFLRDVQTDCTRTGLGGYWVSAGQPGRLEWESSP